VLLQLKPQCPSALQVAEPLATPGHAAQDVVPHELGLLFARHWPLQLCVPAGQTPMQAWPVRMQSPAQIFWSPGHCAPQLVPSHVARPPAGAGHGVHAEVPQDAAELLSAHTPLQPW